MSLHATALKMSRLYQLLTNFSLASDSKIVKLDKDILTVFVTNVLRGLQYVLSEMRTYFFLTTADCRVQIQSLIQTVNK